MNSSELKFNLTFISSWIATIWTNMHD